MNNYRDLIPIAEQIWAAYGTEPPYTGLKITRAIAPTGMIRAVYQPSLCIVLQGAKKSALGGQEFYYQAGQCLFASANVPVTAHILEATCEQPYLAISVTISTESISELVLQHQLRSSSEQSIPALHTAPLPSSLISPLQRLLALVGNEYDAQVLGPMIEREILWFLLNSDLKEAICQLGLIESHHSRLSVVTNWIRENYDQPCSVAQLAVRANMSVPTFHRHFKAITQLTPVQFLKQLRLHEARKKLLAEMDIAEIGYSVGYESPSQFSRDYRKFFGISPAQDRQELKLQIG